MRPVAAGLLALLASDNALFYLALESPHLCGPIQYPDLDIEFPHFARSDVLERLVLAVPGAAEDRAVARFDAGDIGALVEVLPLVDDGNLAALELPVESQALFVVEQAAVDIALAGGQRSVHVDIIVGRGLGTLGHGVVGG